VNWVILDQFHIKVFIIAMLR